MDLQDNQQLAKSYNEIPYTSKIFDYCQPTRLHALAVLKGLTPPSIENSRVLEIGCSFGGNLLPFAIKYPNSQVIGIDLSEYQINVGRKIVEQVGIKNLTLIAEDISKASFQVQFDYIICHGVFSWVPEFVQTSILDVIQKYLQPEGIAFISYNTYPGWHLKDMAKSLMLFGSDSNQKDRLIRTEQSFETLKFTSDIISRKNNAYSQVIKDIFDNIIESSKYYIAHEYLEGFNQAFYFKDFIKKIKKHKLAYLTDGSVPNIYHNLLFKNDEYTTICNMFNNNTEDIEQYLDFISNRGFRTSIITHQDNLINHNVKNDINEYAIARKANKMYLFLKAKYKKNTECDTGKWVIPSTNMININSNVISDLIFNKLEQSAGPISISDVLDEVKHDYPERLDELYDLLWNIIHLNETYLNYFQESLSHYGEYPNIYGPYRNLIKFIRENPNIISMPNIYFHNIEFSPLGLYLADYMDGKKTINDLLKICRDGIENQDIFWSIEDKVFTNAELSDEDILKEINIILNDFYYHGYFNHYS